LKAKLEKSLAQSSVELNKVFRKENGELTQQDAEKRGWQNV